MRLIERLRALAAREHQTAAETAWLLAHEIAQDPKLDDPSPKDLARIADVLAAADWDPDVLAERVALIRQQHAAVTAAASLRDAEKASIAARTAVVAIESERRTVIAEIDGRLGVATGERARADAALAACRNAQRRAAAIADQLAELRRAGVQADGETEQADAPAAAPPPWTARDTQRLDEVAHLRGELERCDRERERWRNAPAHDVQVDAGGGTTFTRRGVGEQEREQQVERLSERRRILEGRLAKLGAQAEPQEVAR